eukprot:sb/3461828/
MKLPLCYYCNKRDDFVTKCSSNHQNKPIAIAEPQYKLISPSLSPGCQWAGECENQRFQRRSYPDTKLVKTEGRGWGMIAMQEIKEGEFVHEYVGEIIDEQEVARRLQHYQATGVTDYYILTVETSRIIDAKPKANNARFMNHACDPNCETQKWNVCGLTCIGLFAKRTIAVGEELTFDYQFDTRGEEKKACLCGSVNCSGYLGVPAKKTEEKKREKMPSKKKNKKKKSVGRPRRKPQQDATSSTASTPAQSDSNTASSVPTSAVSICCFLVLIKMQQPLQVKLTPQQLAVIRSAHNPPPSNSPSLNRILGGTKPDQLLSPPATQHLKLTRSESGDTYTVPGRRSTASSSVDNVADRKTPLAFRGVRIKETVSSSSGTLPTTTSGSEKACCSVTTDITTSLNSPGEESGNRGRTTRRKPIYKTPKQRPDLGCQWAGECENQRFQRRSYPDTKLVKTEGRGWGMIAMQEIKEGEFVHEYVGEIIDEQEVARRLQHYQATGVTDYYILTVETSRIIDAKPKANNARFMNHACDPNCETQKWNVCGLTCIGLFAKRTIAVGEELTFDYQFDTRGEEKKACLCGSVNCSGYLGVPAKKTEEKKREKMPSKKKNKKKKSVGRPRRKPQQDATSSTASTPAQSDSNTASSVPTSAVSICCFLVLIKMQQPLQVKLTPQQLAVIRSAHNPPPSNSPSLNRILGGTKPDQLLSPPATQHLKLTRSESGDTYTVPGRRSTASSSVDNVADRKTPLAFRGVRIKETVSSSSGTLPTTTSGSEKACCSVTTDITTSLNSPGEESGNRGRTTRRKPIYKTPKQRPDLGMDDGEISEILLMPNKPPFQLPKVEYPKVLKISMLDELRRNKRTNAMFSGPPAQRELTTKITEKPPPQEEEDLGEVDLAALKQNLDNVYEKLQELSSIIG